MWHAKILFLFFRWVEGGFLLQRIASQEGEGMSNLSEESQEKEAKRIRALPTCTAARMNGQTPNLAPSEAAFPSLLCRWAWPWDSIFNNGKWAEGMLLYPMNPCHAWSPLLPQLPNGCQYPGQPSKPGMEDGRGFVSLGPWRGACSNLLTSPVQVCCHYTVTYIFHKVNFINQLK